MKFPEQIKIKASTQAACMTKKKRFQVIVNEARNVNNFTTPN